MRISDWRSDVCSSDLPPILLLRSGGRSWSRTGVERGRADAHISDGPVSGAQWRDFLAADGHAQRLRTSSQDLWILCVGWNRVDRKSGVMGRGWYVRVDPGGRRFIKKTKSNILHPIFPLL